jgi:hypothetical protein
VNKFVAEVVNGYGQSEKEQTTGNDMINGGIISEIHTIQPH